MWPDLEIMTLNTQVGSYLWIGGMPVVSPDPRFQAVMCLDGFADYEPHPHQIVLHQPFLDNNDPVQKHVIMSIANQVLWFADRVPTLVHCRAGLNRSGLVVAVCLMKRGMSADEAIELLRRKRSQEVLHNKTFERFLRSLTQEDLRA